MKYLGDKSISSWLEVALRASWIFGIVATSSMVIAVIGLAIAGDSVIPPQFQSGLAINSGGLKISIDAQYINPLHRPVFLSLLLAGAALGGIALVIIRNLQLLFATFAANNPFCPENYKRLRKIGWVILIWSFVEVASEASLGVLLHKMSTLPGLHITTNLIPNLSTILMAALCFVLAEVFHMAIKLKRDNEFTI